MKCSLLSLLSNASLKSTLYDVSIATLAYFGGAIGLVNVIQPFTLSQCLFLSIRWVSCKQQIFSSCFLIQFAKWYLLMGELSSLTFRVNTDRYVVIPAI
jgi:hypothetical protein